MLYCGILAPIWKDKKEPGILSSRDDSSATRFSNVATQSVVARETRMMAVVVTFICAAAREAKIAPESNPPTHYPISLTDKRVTGTYCSM
jgi:hypothetical protein